MWNEEMRSLGEEVVTHHHHHHLPSPIAAMKDRRPLIQESRVRMTETPTIPPQRDDHVDVGTTDMVEIKRNEGDH